MSKDQPKTGKRLISPFQSVIEGGTYYVRWKCSTGLREPKTGAGCVYIPQTSEDLVGTPTAQWYPRPYKLTAPRARVDLVLHNQNNSDTASVPILLDESGSIAYPEGLVPVSQPNKCAPIQVWLAICGTDMERICKTRLEDKAPGRHRLVSGVMTLGSISGSVCTRRMHVV